MSTFRPEQLRQPLSLSGSFTGSLQGTTIQISTTGGEATGSDNGIRIITPGNGDHKITSNLTDLAFYSLNQSGKYTKTIQIDNGLDTTAPVLRLSDSFLGNATDTKWTINASGSTSQYSSSFAIRHYTLGYGNVFTFATFNQSNNRVFSIKPNGNGYFSGSVGIGFTDPQYNLHATGTISFPNLTSESKNWILTYDNQSGQLFYTASSAIGGGGGGDTSGLLTTSSFNAFTSSVITTGSLDTTQSINSSLNIVGNLIVSGNTTIGNATTDIITMNATSINLGTGGSGVLNIDSNTLYVDGNNNRVGIGTTAVTGALDINYNTVDQSNNFGQNSHILLKNSENNGRTSISFRTSASSAANTATIRNIITTGATSSLDLRSYGNNSRVYITVGDDSISRSPTITAFANNNGQVLIGGNLSNPSPPNSSYRLQVEGNTNIIGTLYASNILVNNAPAQTYKSYVANITQNGSGSNIIETTTGPIAAGTTIKIINFRTGVVDGLSDIGDFNRGTGYSTATDVPTTTISGTGTGLTVDINSVDVDGAILDISVNQRGTEYIDGAGSIVQISGGDNNATVGIQTTFNDDFRQFGAPNNTNGTYFILDENIENWVAASTLSYDEGAPISNTVQNNIGNVFWIYNDTGSYILSSSTLFTDGTYFNKTSTSPSYNIYPDFNNTSSYFKMVKNNTSQILVTTEETTWNIGISKEMKINYPGFPIEIKVYS